jgi:DNA repair protein RecO (recombination protein O)
MLQRTEGIVLRTVSYGEADLIVTHLTTDFGIVKTFAKSPRKIRSRFGSSLEPLTLSRISFWGKEDTALPRLTQSDIIHPFHSIRSSFQCFLRLSEIVELTLNFVAERDSNRGVYSLLKETLYAVEKEPGSILLLLHYKLKLLELCGYLPRLHGCGRCGKTGDMFYLAHGTVLCGKCSAEHGSFVALSPAVISLSMNLLGWNYSKINRIKPSGKLVGELSALLDEHVKYILEKNLKTKTFKSV